MAYGVCSKHEEKQTWFFFAVVAGGVDGAWCAIPGIYYALLLLVYRCMPVCVCAVWVPKLQNVCVEILYGVETGCGGERMCATIFLAPYLCACCFCCELVCELKSACLPT